MAFEGSRNRCLALAPDLCVGNDLLDAERGRDELSRLSPIFQAVAGRLLDAPPQERQPIWADFLAGPLRPHPIEGAVSAPAQVTTLPSTRQGLPTARAGRGDEAERRVRLTCPVDMSPREAEWLWSGRVPLGMITMFAGDPKMGKSFVTLAMAAAVSKAAIHAGFTRDQVKDAKHSIGAVAQKHRFQEGARWTWQLPTAATR